MLPVESSKILILEIENILPGDESAGIGNVGHLHKHNIPTGQAGFDSFVAACQEPKIFTLLSDYFSRFTNYSVVYSELNTLPTGAQLQQSQKLVIFGLRVDNNWKIFIIMNGKCYIQLFLRPLLNRKTQTADNWIIMNHSLTDKRYEF